MRKVLIPTKLNSICEDLLRAEGYDVVQDADCSIDALVAQHPDAAALVVRSENVTAEIIDALENLRLVVRAGAGYNTIDVKHARRKGVDVMNTPGANSNAVAEEVVTLVLAAYRHVLRGDSSTREGLWEKKKLMGRELAGKTVGLVGLGNIGQLVVRRLSGFDVRVLGYDPVLSAARAEDLGVELVSMEELFTRCDIVSLHIPETDETRGMIGRKYLELMPAGAMLVNCARAGVLDEDDLRAVKEERDLVFCNDVYPADAPGPKSVADIADIMLPHLGASTVEANSNAARRAAEQMIDYFERGIDKYVVNKGIPAELDEKYQLLAFSLTKVARAYLGNVPPSRIEASFYGGLREYAQWLLGPIVLGLSAEFDPVFDHQDAEAFLKAKGIDFVIREADEKKAYGKSITVDLFEGQGDTVTKVSVRGTVTEGYPMVSRINAFDKLYFEPRGYSALTVYRDRPGMLAKITAVFAAHGINIEDIRCPHDAKSGTSIAVFKLNRAVTQPILDEIIASAAVDKAVSLALD